MPHQFDLETEPRVVYADERLLVLSKPVRMHCASLPRAEGGAAPTLCDWAFERFPELRRASSCPEKRPGEGGLLHRLDYETSGLVLFARDPEAHAFLLARQEGEGFRKEYVLRVSPTESSEAQPSGSRPPRSLPTGPDPARWAAAFQASLPAAIEEGGAGRRDGPAALAACLRESGGDGALPYVECRFRPFGPGAAHVACLGPDEEGRGWKPSRRRRALITEPYRTELLAAEVVGEGLELRVALLRGFRHQIRAQLAWVGLPLLGDGLYGGPDWSRLCLHACALVLRHPEGRELLIEG